MTDLRSANTPNTDSPAPFPCVSRGQEGKKEPEKPAHLLAGGQVSGETPPTPRWQGMGKKKGDV